MKTNENQNSNSFKILFENDHFLAVHKMAGILTIQGRIKDDSDVLWNQLETYLGFKVYPIHRLDREVSGVILFAKTKEGQRAGNGWFEKRVVEKYYEALTPITPSNFSFIQKMASEEHRVLWKSFLMRGKKRCYRASFGKESQTYVKILSFVRLNSLNQLEILPFDVPLDNCVEMPLVLWGLWPLTGRSHQLRFELADRSTPILGDILYGDNYSKNILPPQSIALLARKINFTNCSTALNFFNLPIIIETEQLIDFINRNNPIGLK